MRATSARARRRVASIIVVTLAVVVSAATSSSGLQVPSTSAPQEIVVDREHGLAYQRILVRIGAPAADGLSESSLTVTVDGVVVDGAPLASQPALRDAVSLRVESVDAEAESGVSPLATPAPYPPSGPWLVNTVATYPGTEIPVRCWSPGPCDRAFRLIATMVDPNVRRAVIHWHADATLSYNGPAYPSGAAAGIAIDPAIAIAGPPPQLDAYSSPERVTVSSSAPVAAQVLEFRVPASRLPAHEPRPRATIDVNVTDVTPTDATGPSTAPSARARRTPTVPQGRVAVLSPLPPAPSTVAAPYPGRPGGPVDPVAGCDLGRDCLVRVLVTVGWIGGPPQVASWQARIRWLDTLRVLSTPAQSITIRVVASVATSPVIVQHMRFSGTRSHDARQSPGAPEPGLAVLHLGTTIVGADPALAELAPYLPVPAVAGLRVDVTGGGTKTGINLYGSGRRFAGGQGALELYGSTPFETDGNPLLGCAIGGACDVVVEPWAPDNGGSDVSWTLDVSLYAYAGIQLTFANAP